MKWLIYGASGFVGTELVRALGSLYPDDEIIYAQARAQCFRAVAEEVRRVRPDRVVSCVGRTHGGGVNTIDYLEDRLDDNLRDNLHAPLALMIACERAKVHLTYIGTGCIFDDDANGDLVPFTGSAYSAVKAVTDGLAAQVFGDTVLNARIRMPILDRPHPRNLVTKLLNYPRVLDRANAMTDLPSALPVLLRAARAQRRGTVNLVNPEPISLHEVVRLYKELVDPATALPQPPGPELEARLERTRSNNTLRSSFPDQLPTTRQALRRSLRQYSLRQYSRRRCTMFDQ